MTEAWPDEFEDVVELTGTDTIVGQLLDLAGEAWRHERRGPGGQWVRTPGGDIRSPGGTVRTPGGTLRRSMTPGASPQQRARRVQQIQRRHEQAQTAVAERLAEEKARQALEEAKNEVEKVSEQLKEESKTEEQRKHRMKLALHAITVLGGALLAAVLAHFDVSPVIAGMSSGLPLIIQELVDFKKYL